jgi:hypothetical protein
VNLVLRNVWTRTGRALSFPFEGVDSRDLRDLLGLLDESHWIDAESREAVLVSHDDRGEVRGAWTNEALLELLALVDAVPRIGVWRDLRDALVDATTAH